MRANPIIISLLLYTLNCSNCFAQSEGFAIPSGVEKKQIVDNIGKVFGSVKVSEFRVGDKNVMTVFANSGFGTARMDIYLYIKNEETLKWDFMAFRATNSSTIKTNIDDDGISFYSKSGKKLVFIPADGLDLDYNRFEQ